MPEQKAGFVYVNGNFLFFLEKKLIYKNLKVPTSDTWEFYSQYLENRSTSYNMMIHKRLFPRRWQLGSTMKKATQSRARYELIKLKSN